MKPRKCPKVTQFYTPHLLLGFEVLERLTIYAIILQLQKEDSTALNTKRGQQQFTRSQFLCFRWPDSSSKLKSIQSKALQRCY